MEEEIEEIGIWGDWQRANTLLIVHCSEFLQKFTKMQSIATKLRFFFFNPLK